MSRLPSIAATVPRRYRPGWAAAAAVCAAALSPLRVRLQRWVDRRFYPDRQAVLTAIEELRDRTHAGQAQPEELETALRTALRDPALRVGYRLPGTSRLVDATGAPVDPGDALVAQVRLGGHDIGAIVRGSAGSRELLREAASAGALLIEVVRLRIEVSRALGEAEASRTRLLHAGYEERRRLERDLHDGAQQRLVSLGMAIRLAQRHLLDGTVHVDDLLDRWVAELAVAVTELRQIAHGLRPSSLDDGPGGAEIRPGAGLAGLADRVRAAGGALRLSSPAGGGTLIEAELPCAL
ncbi:histidine kinase [Streptosporangium sandarakinum]